MKQFIRDGDVPGYETVFYEVPRELIMKLHDGFHFMKFGETVVVDLEDFTLEGKSKKAFRNVLNKFAKEGMHFDVLQPPFDAEFFADLKRAPMAVIKDREEEMIAFDMGMAPLANVGINEHSFLQEKPAYFVYKFGSSLYSFEGLRSFKMKYAGHRETKYTGYSHRSSLLFTVLSLVRIDRKGSRRDS